jgi:hypothetical protein
MLHSVLSRDDDRAWKPIFLKLGLVRKEGHIVDQGNMNERVVTFGNQKYIL